MTTSCVRLEDSYNQYYEHVGIYVYKYSCGYFYATCDPHMYLYYIIVRHIYVYSESWLSSCGKYYSILLIHTYILFNCGPKLNFHLGPYKTLKTFWEVNQPAELQCERDNECSKNQLNTIISFFLQQPKQTELICTCMHSFPQEERTCFDYCWSFVDHFGRMHATMIHACHYHYYF